MKKLNFSFDTHWGRVHNVLHASRKRVGMFIFKSFRNFEIFILTAILHTPGQSPRTEVCFSAGFAGAPSRTARMRTARHISIRGHQLMVLERGAASSAGLELSGRDGGADANRPPPIDFPPPPVRA